MTQIDAISGIMKSGIADQKKLQAIQQILDEPGQAEYWFKYHTKSPDLELQD